jgi:hypothetical protein
MSDHDRFLWVYFQLAEISQHKKQFHPRDKFLVLTGVEACKAGYLEIANHCHRIIIDHNKNHLLKTFQNFADAMRDDDFLKFSQSLERTFCNREQAEHLLFQAAEHSSDQSKNRYDQPKESDLASMILNKMDQDSWKND